MAENCEGEDGRGETDGGRTREDGVHDLAVGSARGDLLDAGVIELKELVQPAQQALASDDL